MPNEMFALQKEIQRLRSAVQELTVLNDLAVTASSALETDQMLNVIVEKSVKALEAEQGAILLVTEQPETPLKTLVRQVDRHSRLLTYRVGTNITGWVLKHKQPLIIDDLATDSRFHPSEQEIREIKSLLAVPIQFQGKLIGVLMVSNKKTASRFSPSDLRLLSIIAAQSGQLIRNSQLQVEALEKKRMEHELQMAQRIQLGLLPRSTPEVEGVRIASFFQPVDAVGGDYYDYFILDSDRLGIVVADVSGHGPSAALIMTMVKGILHSITRHFQSAKILLTEMNATLTPILPPEIFVTMLFLVFDPTQKKLSFSNAGHNPLICFQSEENTCRLKELRGPVLGLSPDSGFQEMEIPLHPGDVFVLYTDGITETSDENGEMFGSERLRHTLVEAKEKAAAEIARKIKNSFLTFCKNTPPNDDVAVIVVKIEAGNGSQDTGDVRGEM